MLSDFEKRGISRVLEDYSELKGIYVEPHDRTAFVNVRIMRDEETELITELSDCSWLDARMVGYKFKLSGLQKIVISIDGDLPPELHSVTAPSPEFVLFLVTLFQKQ